MAKVFVIPHTHWDREWYFTTEDSTVLLSYNMKRILEVLRDNPDYKYFTLDGQCSLLEDYLAVNPEDEQLVRDLAAAGRLIIGPWFTQTDTLVPGGESIIRNLLYGKKIAANFASAMPIGYLPDSFGQSAQLPQIYKGFGFKSAIFWRAIGEEELGRSEFIWQGSDGTEIPAIWLRFGYGDGRHWQADKVMWEHKVKMITDNLAKLSCTDNVLYVAGGDQVAIDENFPEVIKFYNQQGSEHEYFMATYEQYADMIVANTDKMPRLAGELTRARHVRVHKSIYSSRMDIKQAAIELENKLVFMVEPLAAIAWRLGFSHPDGLLERAWKYLLESQAHDSIGCCNVDNTNADIKNRLRKAAEIADGMINITCKQMAANFCAADEVAVFNMLPYVRTEVVRLNLYTAYEDISLWDNGKEAEFVMLRQERRDGGRDTMLSPQGEKEFTVADYFASTVLVRLCDIPAMGYKKVSVRARGEKEKRCEWSDEGAYGYTIENEYLKAEYLAAEGLVITDKESGRKFFDCLLFEDGGDDGDSYDYAPPAADQLYYCNGGQVSPRVCKSSLAHSLSYDFTMQLPYDLEARAEKRVNGSMSVKVSVTLRAGERLAEFEIGIDNRVKDHRVRVLFPTGCPAQFSYADQQFGCISRATVNKDAEGWREKGWRELPNTIEPMQSYAALRTDEAYAAVISRNTREYQITGEDCSVIAVTLFRSYGYLGKHDLTIRPGRASGINDILVPTPDAQLLGKLDFNLAWTTAPALADVSKRSRQWRTPLICHQQQSLYKWTQRLERFQLPLPKVELAESFSLLSLEGAGIELAAMKKSLFADKLLLRVFNAGEESSDGEVSNVSAAGWQEADLAENELAEGRFTGIKSMPAGKALTLIAEI